MSDSRTTSILQRLPVILAVTAASYGLQVPTAVARQAEPVARSSPLQPGATRLKKLPGAQAAQQAQSNTTTNAAR